MANARIDFENSCIANLTASRISQKKLRKFRIFEHQSYTTIDFLNPSIEKYMVTNNKPANELSYVLVNKNKETIAFAKTNTQDDIKNETVNGIIGKIQGVNRASNPLKTPAVVMPNK